MKIVTHKFRIKEDQVCYLVNLIDHTGRPLESHVAMNNKEKSEVSEDLALKHSVSTVYHNSGFSIIELMTNEELHKKLEALKISLDKAHKEGNTDKIDYYVKGLNELWEEAGKEMLKNAEEGGWYKPD